MESGWRTARHTPCPHGPTWFSRALETSFGRWILSDLGGVPEVTVGSGVVLSPTTQSRHRDREVG